MLEPDMEMAAISGRIDPGLDRLTAELEGDPGAYRALRPRALRLFALPGDAGLRHRRRERPLILTRAAYDEAAGAALTPPDFEAETHASLHATGFAFDLRFRYGPGAQRKRFSGCSSACRLSASSPGPAGGR